MNTPVLSSFFSQLESRQSTSTQAPRFGPPSINPSPLPIRESRGGETVVACMPQKQKKKIQKQKKTEAIWLYEATATPTDAEKRKWRLACAGLDDWRFRNFVFVCLGIYFCLKLACLVLILYVWVEERRLINVFFWVSPPERRARTNTEVEAQKWLNLLRHRVNKPDSARKLLGPVSLACKARHVPTKRADLALGLALTGRVLFSCF